MAVKGMKEKDLKKLSRAELLQLLIYQTKRVNELQKKLEETNKKLESKRIAIKKSGSIAEAALRLNDIFETAQQAADQYVANVKRNADKALRDGTDID